MVELALPRCRLLDMIAHTSECGYRLSAWQAGDRQRTVVGILDVEFTKKFCCNKFPPTSSMPTTDRIGVSKCGAPRWNIPRSKP